MPRVFDTQTGAFLRNLKGEDEDAVFRQNLQRWRNDPIRWAEERLGLDPRTLRWSENYGPDFRWDGTPDPLAQIGDALAKSEDAGVESGTGTGKTYFAAVLVLWFLDCWEGAQVVTVAPKLDQLKDNVWKEISNLFPRFKEVRPRAELYDAPRIEMEPGRKDWKALARVAGVRAGEVRANKMAGFHGRDLLFILEETPGIPGPIMRAIEQTCVGPHNIRLALGNPESQQDSLHQFCEEHGVRHIRISALDHPNVVLGDHNFILGAVSEESIVRWERNDPGGRSSRFFKAMVRGLSPEEAEDALIRLAWIQEALTTDFDPTDGPALGVDVANSKSGDLAALAFGTGNRLEEVQTFPCPDANALARTRVVSRMDVDRIPADRVGIDSIGVGAGAYNELRRLNRPVQALDASAKPVRISGQAEKFRNLRAQMWWQIREDIRNQRICLPDDPELHDDLMAPTWTLQNGKIQIESKDKLRERLGRSPDKGDAAVFWNWVRQRRAGASKGGLLITI